MVNVYLLFFVLISANMSVANHTHRFKQKNSASRDIENSSENMIYMLKKGIKDRDFGLIYDAFSLPRERLRELNEVAGPYLVKAASNGDEELLSMLFSAGTDINTRFNTVVASPVAITLLFAASKAGNLAMVTRLLKLGANPNRYNYDLRSDVALEGPLHVAAEEGHLAVVKELLKHGADINGDNGYPDLVPTPLEYAIKNHRFSVVQELQKRGAKPQKITLKRPA